MNDFDKFDRNAYRIMTLVIGAGILYGLIVLALIIVGVVVGWHFLQKVW